MEREENMAVELCFEARWCQWAPSLLKTLGSPKLSPPGFKTAYTDYGHFGYVC